MKIIEYFTCENQAHWLERIGLSDWGAGRFLHSLLREGKLKQTLGQTVAGGLKILEDCFYSLGGE